MIALKGAENSGRMCVRIRGLTRFLDESRGDAVHVVFELVLYACLFLMGEDLILRRGRWMDVLPCIVSFEC